jgi:PAS domain S-box-containing protein
MASSKDEGGFTEPTADEMLNAVLRFGRALFVDQSEVETSKQFLGVLRELFPDRYFVLRLVDLRHNGRIRVHGDSRRLLSGVGEGRLTLKRSAVEKTQIKGAVAESALLRVSERWDSPFSGVAAGFGIPLAIAGELYGVLDVGYPLGRDNSESDELKILPLANQLASALRNERLYHETKSLRDYQSRLIEHASALILGIDSNWRIRVCNKALCDLIEVGNTDLIGRDLRDYFPVVDRNELVQVFADGMAGREAVVGKSQVIAGGRHVPVVWRVAAIWSRGSVQAVVAVGQDQTVLSDLQMQLVQAEKMSSMGQIAAGVVHELNNPLTAIGVYSEYLIRKSTQRVENGAGEEGEKELDKLQRIRTSAERIQTFAQDLMQYARPSAGLRTRLSINHVINQSLAFCEHLFSESGVELERSLDAGVPDVHAVPGQLEQVIVNLVTNAVQACGNSGRVEVRSYSEDDNNVVFVVKDEGPGISSDDQERIFEPFFTTKSDGRGTGLGLCIVRNIVETNSGELTLHSAPGAGAEFRCRMPAFSEAGQP